MLEGTDRTVLEVGNAIGNTGLRYTNPAVISDTDMPRLTGTALTLARQELRVLLTS